MNFLEAVQALANERCVGIRRPNFNQGFVVIPSTSVDCRFQDEFDNYLATDWELVGEKPQTETVEVVRWTCSYCNKVTDVNEVITDKWHCCFGKSMIKLRGSYQRPVRPKVKRREEISLAVVHPGATYNLPKYLPKTVKLFAEWEQEEG